LAQITHDSALNATQAWHLTEAGVSHKEKKKKQTEAGETGCSLAFSPCLFNRAENAC
jgi:hypothetical protein